MYASEKAQKKRFVFEVGTRYSRELSALASPCVFDGSLCDAKVILAADVVGNDDMALVPVEGGEQPVQRSPAFTCLQA
jgi:hypothetical protein